METKAVIFDLGGVIASNEWPLVYEKIAKEVGQSKEAVEQIVRPLFEKWCLGDLREDDLWNEFEKLTNNSLSKVFTKDFFLCTYKEWSKDIEGTWNIIKELHAKGIRLSLLSNIVDTHVKANEEMGRFQRLRDLGFEAFVFSYEEGCIKPDAKIYRIILDRLKLPAESCVFIDDKVEATAGAEKVGMKGIQFASPESFKKELINLGLL